jgi:erythronate-4-phosphate dehydrogenase
MLIVADENMPLVESLFSDFGTIVRKPGRNLTADDVANADALLVRSVTQVNSQLLENSRVKFVGTATIGVDHIDQDYLKAQGIGFSRAPGCNANSVVDYVLSALMCICEEDERHFRQLSVGVIGAGNVGGRLISRLKKLGLEVVAYDPYVSEADCELVDLNRVLECDVVSLHVPITHDGEHPTHHMISMDQLASMNDKGILINSSRGSVVDNIALKSHLVKNAGFKAVLDVWEQEPEIDRDLLDLVDIATSHIAGYSLDGKYNGTFQVYQALCKHFGLPARKRLAQMLPEPEILYVGVSPECQLEPILNRLVHVAYDIRRDDRALRRAVARTDDIPAAFDRLRKHYPVRREFSSLSVKVRKKDLDNTPALEAIGFKVKAKS